MAWRANLGPWWPKGGRKDGHKDGRRDYWKFPLCSTGHWYLEPLSKKRGKERERERKGGKRESQERVRDFAFFYISPLCYFKWFLNILKHSNHCFKTFVTSFTLFIFTIFNISFTFINIYYTSFNIFCIFLHILYG